MDKIKIVQDYLNREDKDAWITLDYENKNRTMLSFLGERMLTRKIFLVVPKEGKAYLICHQIDTVFLRDQEILSSFNLKIYKTWKELLDLEKELFKDYSEVLMDVSEDGLLPRVSLADDGSVSYIRSLGKKVFPSQDLLQLFTAVYDRKAYESQKRANQKNLQICKEAFMRIREDILGKGESDEYEIQKFIVNRYAEEGMVFDDPPIVAIDKNASDPHYGPTEKAHSAIRRGSVVLIDMWAKEEGSNTVYSDITWMGYVGEEVPENVQERFSILRRAVDTGFAFLKENLKKRRVEGYEVDDAVRRVVDDSGYGAYFTHRTGHNIAVDVSPHGPGVNIDNYESHDTRRIIPKISFSLEPGIYASDFGMRSETNVYITEDYEPVMIGGRQEEVVPILKLAQ